MKLSNTFVQGKMNKDIDERLLPKGQYPHAENIRVANSQGSDMGAIENVRGNEKLTNLGLVDAETIGTFADSSNQKIYWFTTSVLKDQVIEYDVLNQSTNILLESSKPNSLLNFSKDFLITGVVKIINGDSKKDLLAWTDDNNEPRCINIERAKTYVVDGFEVDDISLIKKPPRYAPKLSLTYTPTTTENNMQDKFLSFATRYKYLDGGYSAISSFTNYAFAPAPFDLDYQTMENEGMRNNFNAVVVTFDTGDKRVTDVEVIFKESNSNTPYIIDTYNKANEAWEDNEKQSITFANNKVRIALPEDELFRNYDNVPRKAKALELIGTRIAFGNYVEQYDLVNIYGENINLDVEFSLTNKDLSGLAVPQELIDSVNFEDSLKLDLTDKELKTNNRLTLDVKVKNTPYSGDFRQTFDFIFNRDFEDAIDLAEDPEFKYFIETIITTNFTNNFELTRPDGVTIDSVQGFEVYASTVDSITLRAPIVVLQEASSNLLYANFRFDDGTTVFYKEIAIDSSLKTNRSYEVGVVYMDEYNRATTVLVPNNNTIFVDQKYSVNQNKIVANINSRPPVWADRYKLVVKQNKGDYQTIYTNLFYEDGLYRWIKLEGASIGKVAQGDTLIVKSDLGGALEDVVKTRVLEVSVKNKDFIEGNEDEQGEEISEEAGVYMKIKPTGFDMNFTSKTARTYEGGSHLRYKKPTYTAPEFGEVDATNVFQNYPLNVGSRVRLFIEFKAKGSISYRATYDQRHTVNNDYPSVQAWFEEEVEDLGSFGEDFTYKASGQAKGTYGTGYGFTDGGKKFFVISHRDGTASRRITTTVKMEILSTEGIVIFETEPTTYLDGLFYETEQTFDIVDGLHTGNIQDQNETGNPAIVELDAFNCYVQGNGAESYRYKDARFVGTNNEGNQLVATYLNLDMRPSINSIEEYREVRRFSDITYSEPYSENSNVNGLNVFNLSKANYKEDIDKKYGFIQHLHSRDTNLTVFQEDKVSYVMYGKDILFNANGSSNVSAIDDVLGNQVMYTGEYGISRNPESIAYDANNIYFLDAKRGCACRLSADGITEISMSGMRRWFKDAFKGSVDSKKLGSYDPYLDQYVIHNSLYKFNKPVNIDCNGEVTRGDFQGVQDIIIDYGIGTGRAGFDYVSNGVPVKYDITIGEETFSTGFIGDISYNDQLRDLGYPNVSSVGSGVYTFNKSGSIPRYATVRVTAPFCGTKFTLKGKCIPKGEATVISLVLGDSADRNKTAKSRYSWNNQTYKSPITTFDNTFAKDFSTGVQMYQSKSGTVGSIEVPLNFATVRIEDYRGINQSIEWVAGQNKLGYLVSNTLYRKEDLNQILDEAEFLNEVEVVGVDGSTTRYAQFNYNPEVDEKYLYLIWDYRNEAVVIDIDTKIKIYFDSSGSMNSSLAPLIEMRNTILKDRLLPLYNDDSDLYDESVTVENWSNERTLEVLNMKGETPFGNAIVLVFQDEAHPIYHSSNRMDIRTTAYETDLFTYRNRLSSFKSDYYRAVIFQVEGNNIFPNLIQAIQTGTGNYAGIYGLSDRSELNYKYGLQDGGTPEYYMNQIVVALTELGYEL